LSLCGRSGGGGVGHRFQTRFLIENEGERVENESRREESWERRRALSARRERSQKEMRGKWNEEEILIRNTRAIP
jgi:hypothetical protein